MKRTNDQLGVRYGIIRFPAEFIDFKSYKPGTKKVTDGERSKVTGYMIYNVIAIKETLDFTLYGLTDEVLASIKEYLNHTKEAICTYPAASTGGATKQALMYPESDLDEEIMCVEADGSIIWKLPISFVEM